MSGAKKQIQSSRVTQSSLKRKHTHTALEGKVDSIYKKKKGVIGTRVNSKAQFPFVCCASSLSHVRLFVTPWTEVH